MKRSGRACAAAADDAAADVINADVIIDASNRASFKRPILRRDRSAFLSTTATTSSTPTTTTTESAVIRSQTAP